MRVPSSSGGLKRVCRLLRLFCFAAQTRQAHLQASREGCTPAWGAGALGKLTSLWLEKEKNKQVSGAWLGPCEGRWLSCPCLLFLQIEQSNSQQQRRHCCIFFFFLSFPLSRGGVLLCVCVCGVLSQAGFDYSSSSFPKGCCGCGGEEVGLLLPSF
jgi:hypothetical protein